MKPTDQQRKTLAQMSREDKARLLARARRQGVTRKATAAAPPLVPQQHPSEEVPLALVQRRLWIMAQMDADTGNAYVLSGSFRVEGSLDVSALRGALCTLLAHHDVLRTHIVTVDGEPHQRLRAVECDEVLEVRHLTAADNVTAAFLPHFELAEGPLWRVQLLHDTAQSAVLRIALHHLIADGWSLSLFMNALSCHYSAALKGDTGTSQRPALQYADYVRWQQRLLDDGGLAEQQRYWVKRLRGAPERLLLPTDRPRPLRQTMAGGRLPLRFDADLTNALKALGRQHRCTPFMTLLASWSALMARLSGQNDIVTGIPVAGRGRSELEMMLGMFVNTQALRVELSESLDTAGLLAQVRRGVLEAQQHADIPFEQVVEAVSPERSLAYSPLFQTLFTLQNTPKGQLCLPEASVTPLATDTTTAPFDLSVALEEVDGEWVGALYYATALFDTDTLTQWLTAWTHLLRSMIDQPAVPLNRLTLLTPDRRTQVLDTFNATTSDYPVDLTLHRLIERQVMLTPDAVAVVYEGEALTYEVLNQRADQIARWLLRQSVAADQRVAIALPRGSTMVIAALAVLKAGGAYVPLDPAYPDERLRYILEDSRPTVLITISDIATRMAPLPDSLTLAVLDGCDPWDVNTIASSVLPTCSPSSLAYLIYTSGSTGQPKGVMVPHRAVVNFLCHQQQQLAVASHDRLLAVTTLSFDIHVLELWLPLLSGAELHIATDALRHDGAALARYLCQHDISLFQATPATWKLLLANDWQGAPQLTGLIGGEACPLSLAHQLAPRVGALWNMYGPTETTVWSTMQRLSAQDEHIRIGRPIANTRTYVLDEQQNPVPIGVVGELYIGGVGVACGYYGKPELTAERFLPDPFVADNTARMYRTGDRVRWCKDGALEYLGRNDFQVKLRGFRIELGEIEAVLQRCDGVQDAFVIAQSVEGSEPQLVAYCTPCGTTELKAAQLKAVLSGVLPEYMVPSAFVILAHLPLTPNGKLDRNALPAPDADAFVHQQYEAPKGTREKGLAALWQEVLGVERVGRYDHFFTLGGHSLLAVQLMTRVRQSMHGELSLDALFAHPTLQAMAASLELDNVEVLPDIMPRTTGAKAPLSPAQRRIWFLSKMDDRVNRAYQLAGTIALHGALAVPVLRQALDTVVARHEALRTCIIEENDMPLQWVAAAEVGFPLSMQTLSTEAVLPSFAPDMPLDKGPLACGQLVRFNDQHHVLQLAFHHVMADGWSVGIFLREVSNAYAAIQAGHTPELPPLRVQYGDVAAWQQAVFTHERLAAQRQFWQEQLADVPACLALPTDRPRPAVQTYSGAAFSFVLDKALTAKLYALSQHTESTLFMTLVAAWGALMSRLSGQRDVVIGTPIAGRDHPDTEPLIGMFVNTLPLRLNFEDELTTKTLLAQVKATTLAAQQHAQLPFEHLVEAIAPDRSLSYSPLFQVMLALQNTPSAALTLPGLTLQPQVADTVSAQCDISVLLHEEAGQLHGAVHFATALFDADTIARWMDYWIRLLKGMVAEPERPIMALPILSVQERERAVHGMNAIPKPYPPLEPLPILFARQAAQHPKALAVCTHEGRWRYGELERSANRLAHWLIAQNVGPESRVAVLLERGKALPLALLGVLKAGGAYVPLDTAYPDERLRYLLRDSTPVRVLTSASLQTRLATVAPDIPVTLMDNDRLWANQSAMPPEVSIQPHHLAYVIYTSGSTGQPKGVMVEHRQIAHLIDWHCHQFSLQVGTAVSCVAGLGFDAAVWELWPALCAGGCVYMPAPDIARDPEQLLTWWRAQPISISFLPTPVAEWAFSQKMTHLTLHTLLVGGDRLVRHPPREAGFTVVNNYGPTENAVVATSGVVTADDEVLHIGRPIGNTRVYLLDGYHQPVPQGAVGELYVAGAQVARGYLNRPEMTTERFMPDPFFIEEGARMYRTGDLARWRDDGTLDYLGRNDCQVKLRGFRVELGEVEAALVACDGVEHATVIAKGNASQRYLVAYYTSSVSSLTSALLQHQLSERLPAYMVPSIWMPLAALPLTANGKVDRRALPEPDDSARIQQTYLPPQGEWEMALADLWRALLGVARVGRHDDFFALGGHSLLGLQLISRIRRELQRELPLSALFAYPTLAEQAAQLGEAAKETSTAIVPQPVEGPIPLSLAQQRLWFLSHMDAAASASYVIAGKLKLHGALNVTVLQQALDHIVVRHESLRTHIETVNGEPRQIIDAPSIGFPLERIVWTSSKAIPVPFSPVFDLARGPLLQGQLISLNDDDHLLTLAVHHVIADGWSMGVLMNELSALYRTFLAGKLPNLTPLPLQYRDYARWQRRYLTSERLQHQHAFWVEHLRNAPDCISLPLDHPRPARQDYCGRHITVTLSASLVARLRTLSRTQHCTLYMVMMAAWAALMARLAGQDDIVIGTPTAGRHRYELESLIGMFVTTQALRIAVPIDVSVAQLLSSVRETVLAAQQHAEVPFEQIVDAVSPQRSLAHSPLFQVMLGWQAQVPDMLALADDIDTTLLPVDLQTAQCDLSLELSEQGDTIHGVLRYATALFNEATVTRWLGYWERLLDGMVAAPDQPIMALPILSGHEYDTLTTVFNATQCDYPRDASLAALFEAQAAATPDAIAVVNGTHSCCYSTLNANANHLAHRLIAHGVEAGDRIAVALPRGELLVTAILAVLKAGGCYVPIDPRYPASRIQFMLSDSTPRMLLASADVCAAFPPLPLRLKVLDPAQCLTRTNVPYGNPKRATSAAALAYIMYTSGSTGRPKGVMVTQRNVLRLIFANGYAAFNADDRVACLANPAFDASTMELWSALLCGGQLIIFDPDTVMDANAFTTALADHRVTVMFMTIALFNQHAETLQPYLPSLRYLLVGGESLDLTSVKRTLHAGSPQHFLHVYGPTETTTFATAYRMNEADPNVTQMPIGRPISNTAVYILDAFGQPAPTGVTGELYIGGDGVAEGYLNLPEQTSERFVSDPFSATLTMPNARLYRTGDLGYWQPDGNIMFQGRNDFQVKLRGFRIELGEIEAALRACVELEQAVVVAQGSNVSEKRLVAYYTCHEGQKVTPDTLSEWLHKRLPAFMVPSAWVPMTAIPLNCNGKIDRRALPAPDTAEYVQAVYEPPLGEMEERLATLWQRLLHVERVGRHDDFFALGGHSLMAVRFINEAQQQGLDIPLTTLFSSPRLSALAEQLAHSSLPLCPDMPLAFRQSGQQRPLFLVPEASGELLYGPLLAAYIDSDIPVHGLPGPDRRQPAFRTIEGAAARFVTLIREVQSEGPYRLLGWSFGGIMAYEVAAQLMGQDQTVEFLGMLDTRLPDREDGRVVPMDTLFALPDDNQRMKYLLQGDIAALATTETLQAQVDTLAQTLPLWEAHYTLGHAHGLLPAGWSAEYYHGWLSHRLALLSAEYDVPRLPLTIDLFVAQDEPEPVEEGLGWYRLLPREHVRCHAVPGTHARLVSEPHVQEVGKALSAALNACRLTVPKRSAYTPVMTLQVGQPDAPTVLCLPGAGDNVFAFMPLAQCLPPTWRVIGLQPRGLWGDDVPHTDVAAAATFYQRALEGQLPLGPLYILGHSFGGWVALALAQRLEAAGIPLECVILADSDVPEGDRQEYSSLQALYKLIELLGKQGNELNVDRTQLAAMTPRQRLITVHRAITNQGIMPHSTTLEALHSILRVLAINLRTGHGCSRWPQAPVTLVVAADTDVDQTQRWQQRWPDIEVIYSQGNHVQMLKWPHIEQIRQRMNK